MDNWGVIKSIEGLLSAVLEAVCVVWVTLQNFAPVLGRSWQGRWADPASPPASISKFCWEALCHPGGRGKGS